jgi:hypothetical protein
MKAALKKGVETGTLVMVKSSYKVSADAKKPVKAKKPTVAKVKKPVAKKVSIVPCDCHHPSLPPFIVLYLLL